MELNPNGIPTRWHDRHRGPYRLHVTRPGMRGRVASDWLAGHVDSDDIEAEALALLADARDTILAVDAWSIHEGQFVMTFK